MSTSCEVCGKTKLPTQKVCSIPCRQIKASIAANLRKKVLADERRQLNSVKCEYCGTLTQNKKYCSRSCAVTVNNLVPKRVRTAKVEECKMCRTLTSAASGFCSRTCIVKARKEAWYVPWTAGEFDPIGQPGCAKPGILRKALLEEFGPSCWNCRKIKINPYSSRPLIEMDHIDGNRFNNKRSNLRLLCTECHSMTPTYKHLNRKLKG